MSEFRSLLPPNATPQERAVERAVHRTTDLATPIRDIWSPDDCPEHLLPWLAWALSLDSWKNYWPVPVKRQQIRRAVEIARSQGTVKSVRDIVKAFGSALTMREWFQQEPIAVPYSVAFTLTIGAGVPRTLDYQEDIVREIVRTKPRRSQFSLVAGLEASGGLGVQGFARALVQTRLIAEEI